MPHISKKLVRVLIMDALDEVLKGKSDTRLSKDTQMVIIEAVEKIAETVQNDVDVHPKPLELPYAGKTKRVAPSRTRVPKTAARKKKKKGAA